MNPSNDSETHFSIDRVLYVYFFSDLRCSDEKTKQLIMYECIKNGGATVRVAKTGRYLQFCANLNNM